MALAIPDGGFAYPGACEGLLPEELQYYRYFGSGSKVPYNLMSNFAHIHIVMAYDEVPAALMKLCPDFAKWIPRYVGIRFPSSEHLWQALKANNAKTFYDFTIDGRWGRLSAAAFLAFAPKTQSAGEQQKWALGKYQVWSAKDNVGILAKMASNPDYAEQLNYVPGEDMIYERETPATPELEKEVWLAILRLKFDSHPYGARAKRLLLETGHEYLLEHVRGAVKQPLEEHWGGCYDKKKKQIVGQNNTGRYIMALRRIYFDAAAGQAEEPPSDS